MDNNCYYRCCINLFALKKPSKIVQFVPTARRKRRTFRLTDFYPSLFQDVEYNPFLLLKTIQFTKGLSPFESPKRFFSKTRGDEGFPLIFFLAISACDNPLKADTLCKTKVLGQKIRGARLPRTNQNSPSKTVLNNREIEPTQVNL